MIITALIIVNVVIIVILIITVIVIIIVIVIVIVIITVIIIIIINTRPKPAFGRLGLGGSSGVKTLGEGKISKNVTHRQTDIHFIIIYISTPPT